MEPLANVLYPGTNIKHMLSVSCHLPKLILFECAIFNFKANANSAIENILWSVSLRADMHAQFMSLTDTKRVYCVFAWNKTHVNVLVKNSKGHQPTSRANFCERMLQVKAVSVPFSVENEYQNYFHKLYYNYRLYLVPRPGLTF